MLSLRELCLPTLSVFTTISFSIRNYLNCLRQIDGAHGRGELNHNNILLYKNLGCFFEIAVVRTFLMSYGTLRVVITIRSPQVFPRFGTKHIPLSANRCPLTLKRQQMLHQISHKWMAKVKLYLCGCCERALKRELFAQDGGAGS
jgi:hypothetical protein